MKKLYVFGNQYLKEDSFAVDVARELKKEMEVVFCDSPEALFDCEEAAVILDVVKGIEEPIIINDLPLLKTRKMLSLHDFDLAFFLKLFKEMGGDKKFKIIGLPEKGNIKILSKWVKENI